MANPFPAKFDSDCQSCGEWLDEGELTYAIDGIFICSVCAIETGRLCECGKVKKEDFEKCYDCYQENNTIEEF